MGSWVYNFDKGAHSVYSEFFHLVVCCKYRHNFIDDFIADVIMKKFMHIGKRHNVVLKEFGWESDHVHLLFKASPSTNLSKFICSFKTQSSRAIRSFSTRCSSHSAFWSSSYCLLTCGGAPLEIIKRYVESQRGSADGKF